MTTTGKESRRTQAERTFGWSGVGIRVECHDSAHIRWLEEFLRPSFDAGFTGPVDFTVRVVADDSEFKERSAAAPASEELIAFVLDTSLVRLPGRFSSPGRACAFDTKYGVHYVAGCGRRKVRIVAPTSGHDVRAPLMRVVREIAANHSRSQGELFLHAACVANGARGVLIAGPKRAGKSTLLTHLLLGQGVSYVANDRVLASPPDRDPAFRGVPVIVCLREGLFDYFPDLRRELVRRWYRWELSLEEARARPDPPPRRPSPPQ